MHIVSSNIKMQAQHQLQQSASRQESLQLRVGNPGTPPPSEDQVSLSPEALSAASATSETESDGLTVKDRMAINILRRLFKEITGHDMVLHTPGDLRRQLQGGSGSSSQPTSTTSTSSQPTSAGFGLAYDAVSSYEESESLSFAAQGVLKTADGKELEFSVQMNISRSFSERNSVSLRAGDPIKIDPLVINYGGNAAELDSTRFEFDLDSDGDSEQIANLKAGSALLALDKNGNGRVDNGQELFGPNSGDGFAELAQYDQDGNNFIDEKDAVYDKLRLWMRDEAGNSQLMALGQMGIGAIYVGKMDTPYRYTDTQNQTLGQLAATGLFFREDGGVGTVQQIDYSV